MALTPIFFEPGVTKNQSAYAAGKTLSFNAERMARGRWTTTNNIRFTDGWPEQLAGDVKTNFAGIRAIARSMKQWLGVDNKIRTMVGTANGLYVWDGTTTTEVTPLTTLTMGGGSITYTTTNNSTSVVVTNGSPVAVGDWVFISMATPVGGIQLNGWVPVTAIGSGNFTVTSPTAATSGTSGAATSTLNLPRTTLSSNPITTIGGSQTVSIAVPFSYIPNVGDIIYISGASSVGGILLNGAYAVTAASLNIVQVHSTIPALSGATGGGSAVVVTFNVSNANNPSYLQPGWTLAPYGGLMSVCNTGDTLYFYDPVAGGTAYPIANAPTKVNAHFVTPERFIVALGTSSSPLQMAWCDQAVPTQWTSLPNNTANSGRNLIGGAYFTAGIPVVNGISLAFTDKSAFLMSYTGDNEIYSTPRIADNAGCCSQWAVCEMGEAAYWRDTSAFWSYNGSVVRLPQDDIHDFIFGSPNTNPEAGPNKTYFNKAIAGSNKLKNEIWFFDVSSLSNEIDRHAIYQIDQACWSVPDPGEGISRTAWTDADLLTNPYSIDITGSMYQQEIGSTFAEGATVNLLGSFMDVQNGDVNIAITGLVVDMSHISGTIDFAFGSAYYPQDVPTVDAQAALTSTSERIDVRDDGKMFNLNFTSTPGATFRLGMLRAEITPQSARK